MKSVNKYIPVQQREALDAALESLKPAFPRLKTIENPEEREAEKQRRLAIIEHIVAPYFLGPARGWSKPLRYSLSEGLNTGGFCVYCGIDPDVAKDAPATDSTFALLHVRKESTDEQRKYGAVGGHLKYKEQVYQGVHRETLEELRDDKGKPIFVPDENRYVPILPKLDNSAKGRNPVNYTGFAYELSADEIRAIKTHIERFETDKDYRNASIKASGGETKGLRWLPLIEITGLAQQLKHKGEKMISRADFPRSEQYGFYIEVANRLGIGLQPQTPSSRLGYTIGDMKALYNPSFSFVANLPDSGWDINR